MTIINFAVATPGEIDVEVHLLDIRASFIVERGDVRQLGKAPRRRGYRCSTCGDRGHNERTCTEKQP